MGNNDYHFIKENITYFWLKSKICFNNVPLMTDNTLALTSAFLDISPIMFLLIVFVAFTKTRSNNYYHVIMF